jgi:hypothetical protein
MKLHVMKMQQSHKSSIDHQGASGLAPTTRDPSRLQVHWDVAKLSCEVVLIPELHPNEDPVAARKSARFHLRFAASHGHRMALLACAKWHNGCGLSVASTHFSGLRDAYKKAGTLSFLNDMAPLRKLIELALACTESAAVYKSTERNASCHPWRLSDPARGRVCMDR